MSKHMLSEIHKGAIKKGTKICDLGWGKKNSRTIYYTTLATTSLRYKLGEPVY